MLSVLVVLFGVVLPLLDALFALLVFCAVGRRIPRARLLSLAVVVSSFVCTCCLPTLSQLYARIVVEAALGGFPVPGRYLVDVLVLLVHYLLVGCLITALLDAKVNKIATPPAPPPTPPTPPAPPEQPTDFSDLPRYPG